MAIVAENRKHGVTQGVHQITSSDNPSMAANPAVTSVNKRFNLALIKVTEFCTPPSSKLSLLYVPFLQTTPFQKGKYINMTDALHIFIKLHTLLTPFLEAIGLYAII